MFEEYRGKKVKVTIDNYHEGLPKTFVAHYSGWESEDDEDVPAAGYYEFYLETPRNAYAFGWNHIEMELADDSEPLSKPEDMM